MEKYENELAKSLKIKQLCNIKLKFATLLLGMLNTPFL